MGFDHKAIVELTKEVTEDGKTKVLGLDNDDVIILRWVADFYPRMKKYTEDSNEYAWVYYKTLLEENPTLKMCKKTLRRRFIKMTELGILTHKHLKVNGSFSYYGFGENYAKLLWNGNGSFDSSNSETNSEIENETSMYMESEQEYKNYSKEGQAKTKNHLFEYSSTKSSNKGKTKKKKKNKEYRHMFGSFDDIISFYSNGNRMLKLEMEDFVQMRYAEGKKLSYPGLVKIFSRVDELSSDNDFAKIAILNKSTRNSWADVFPLNQEEWEEVWKEQSSYLKYNDPQEYELQREQYCQDTEFKYCGG